MLTLLNPLALGAMLLLSIPIILHLFKPKKVRQMPFSSLRWLRASQHRMSRRIRWHQVMLFLLRAAFLLLLILALARPIFSPGGSADPVERVVIVDVSASMQYHPAGRDAVMQIARQAAAELLERQPSGDRATVILAGAQPRVLGPLAHDSEPYRTELRALEAGYGSADFAAAIDAVRPLVRQARANAKVELVFVTDNHSSKWHQAAVAAAVDRIKQPLNVRVLDVGYDEPRNTWIGSASVRELGPDQRAIVAQVVTSASEATPVTVRLSNLAGAPEMIEQISVQPQQPRNVVFRLPPRFDASDQVALLSLEPGDALAADDRYWLNLADTGAARVLVIEPTRSPIESLAAGFHLRTALEALSSPTGGQLSVTRRDPSQVSSADVANTDAVILIDVPRLADPVVQAIQQRVHDGAGLAVFVGPTMDPSFYNTLASGDQPLMAVQLGAVQTTRREPASLRLVDADHALLRGLDDPSYSDLGRTTARAWREVQPQGNAQVLLSLSDGTPAMVTWRVGEGVGVLMNFTASDLWSDLPRRQSFVPLVDRLVSHLTGGVRGPGAAGFDAGRPVLLPLPEADAAQGVRVTTPSGRQFQATLSAIAGRRVLRLDDTEEVGVYQIAYHSAGEQRVAPLVVQASRQQSFIAAMNHQTLAAWWSPAAVEIVRPDPLTGRVVMPAQRFELTPWLILLACAALMAEMYFVHRQCPAVNPQVAQSVNRLTKPLAA